MTKEELDSLWKSFKKDNNQKDRNLLIEHYYSNVEKIAKSVEKKMNYRVSKEELTSHGVDGLFKAINAYDLSRNVKFEFYSYPRIRGSMIDGLRSEDWVPRSVRSRQTKIEEKLRNMESQKGCKIETIEAIKKIGIDPEDYIKHPKKFNAILCSSLDSCIQPTDNDDNENKKDFNKYLKAKNVDLDKKMKQKDFLSKFLNKGLKSSEKLVIYYYYYENLTMKEIARRIKKTESNVSQIHKIVIKKIKNKLRGNRRNIKDFLV